MNNIYLGYWCREWFCLLCRFISRSNGNWNCREVIL